MTTTEPLKRVREYPFLADCTLYLEEGKLVQMRVEGKWYSPVEPNDVEWQANAEHALDWIVGTLHHHDPAVTSRVEKHTVQRWIKKPGRDGAKLSLAPRSRPG